jgi:BirA family biotin operon repressor/biotin-[acetyl-CoA-carboxylase] ligase
LNSLNKGYIGRPHLFFEELDSTNSYAQLLIAKSNPCEGTAISADFQSQGRGQYGRIWTGDKGKNIFTTIIIKPSFIKPADQFLINQAITLAVCDVCKDAVQQDVAIKWPNDIYINDRKVCGILIQYTISGNTLQYGIIGIGMNINQKEFSPDLPNPTSLAIEGAAAFDLIEIRKKLFSAFELRYEQLKKGRTGSIKKEYQSRLYRINEKALFNYGDKPLEGVIRGVDDTGKLLLSVDNVIQSYNLNELRMVINHTKHKQ